MFFFFYICSIGRNYCNSNFNADLVGRNGEIMQNKSQDGKQTFDTKESDPMGYSQHEPGAKMDAGKNRVGMVLGNFPRALKCVSEVGTFGANKYTSGGWKSVPEGESRYEDALWRHLLELGICEYDEETNYTHLAHLLWNGLAWLELRQIRMEGLKGLIEASKETASEGIETNKPTSRLRKRYKWS